MSAYEMAATVEFGLDAKQGLLDLRSESARLKLVARLCRAAIKRLDFVDRAQARARSNGRCTSAAEQRLHVVAGRHVERRLARLVGQRPVGAVGEQQFGQRARCRCAPPCAAACSRPAGGRWGSRPRRAATARRRGRRPRTRSAAAARRRCSRCRRRDRSPRASTAWTASAPPKNAARCSGVKPSPPRTLRSAS